MKPILELIRHEEDHKHGTFGILKIQKKIFCFTLEPSDRENLKGRSSIPAQQYDCMRHLSAKFGETFEVLDVPNRTDILFHPGNIVEQTKGCIILGQHIDYLKENRAVLNSGETFRKFMLKLAGKNLLHLTIKEDY